MEALEEVLALDPSHLGAAGRLAEARRNAQLSTWNSQADKAAIEGRWADALVQLENGRSLDPNYPDLNLGGCRPRPPSAGSATCIVTFAHSRLWVSGPLCSPPVTSWLRSTPAAPIPTGWSPGRRPGPASRRSRERYAEGLAELDRGCSRELAVGQFEAVMREQPGFQDVCRPCTQRRGSGTWPSSRPSVPRLVGHKPNRRPATPLVGPPPPPGPPGQVPGRPAGGAPPPPPGRRRTGLIIAAAMLLVVALATGGVLLLRDRLGNREGTGSPAGTTSTAAESPSSSETATPGSPSPTSNTSELQTHIPTAILPNCQDYSPPAGDPLEADLVGALSCQLTAAGAPKTVWYFLYSDTAAMNTAYNAYITGEFKTDDCLQAREKLDYNVEVDGKKDLAGVLHCYDSDGATYFAWTHDVLRIVTFAEDKDLSYAQMKKWWNGAGPIR